MVSGPGIVEFSRAAGKTSSSVAKTMAYFSAPGTYSIEPSASDGLLTTTHTLDQLVNPQALPTPPPPVTPPPPPPEPEDPLEQYLTQLTKNHSIIKTKRPHLCQ